MRGSVILIAVAVGLSGCAKPVLDLPEPDAAQRTSAKSTLNTTVLAKPRRPFTFEGIKDGYFKADSRVVIAVNRVCRRLKPTMKDLRCDAAIKKMPHVYRSEQINAFADEYDNIGVSSVLLVKVRVEAELAAVLAHEYAHIMLGHVKKMISSAVTGRAIAGALRGCTVQ